MEQTLSKQVTPTNVHMHVYTSATMRYIKLQLYIMSIKCVPQPSLVVTPPLQYLWLDRL